MVTTTVMRARFGAQANAVAEAEVDRALSVPTQRGVVRAEMSEIVLPARAEAPGDESPARSDGPEAVERAARAHSIAPSAERGANQLLAFPSLSTIGKARRHLTPLTQHGRAIRARPNRDLQHMIGERY